MGEENCIYTCSQILSFDSIFWLTLWDNLYNRRCDCHHSWSSYFWSLNSLPPFGRNVKRSTPVSTTWLSLLFGRLRTGSPFVPARYFNRLCVCVSIVLGSESRMDEWEFKVVMFFNELRSCSWLRPLYNEVSLTAKLCFGIDKLRRINKLRDVSNQERIREKQDILQISSSERYLTWRTQAEGPEICFNRFPFCLMISLISHGQDHF